MTRKLSRPSLATLQNYEFSLGFRRLHILNKSSFWNISIIYAACLIMLRLCINFTDFVNLDYVYNLQFIADKVKGKRDPNLRQYTMFVVMHNHYLIWNCWLDEYLRYFIGTHCLKPNQWHQNLSKNDWTSKLKVSTLANKR